MKKNKRILKMMVINMKKINKIKKNIIFKIMKNLLKKSMTTRMKTKKRMRRKNKLIMLILNRMQILLKKKMMRIRTSMKWIRQMNKKILIKSQKKIIYMTIIKRSKFLNKYLLNNDKVSNHRNKNRVNKKNKIITSIQLVIRNPLKGWK